MNTTPQNADLSPEEAARALSDIRATQARAVRSTPWFPAWFVIGIGLSVTCILAASDPLTPVPMRIAGIVLATAGITGCSVAVGRSGSMRAHKSVTDAGGLIGYFVWVLSIVGLTIPFALFLAWRDVPYAAACAGLAMTAAMGLTGPFLARWISGRNASKIERGK
ncbi:hypothetical protein [Planomonospora venezuelensis]|uniref:Formate-dependent nitrite reductase membrane component NrfD n=1 Tax=Planomonospora venezuelensis TaxID=1999 RepID=A0A841CY83_PLAVE|nr:hypothetical protein [Planomonospora venezuelensis]MBB5962931.1 formate-dependent nitrite reductase membrane component NrfD [Planomonospora venezuelensis]GIN04548.1 hypothetical protein Pve01_62060 [Planomonospora venezuelensis]